MTREAQAEADFHGLPTVIWIEDAQGIAKKSAEGAALRAVSGYSRCEEFHPWPAEH